jgi:hypothetical protein
MIWRLVLKTSRYNYRRQEVGKFVVGLIRYSFRVTLAFPLRNLRKTRSPAVTPTA